jgi:hypothetical protein
VNKEKRLNTPDLEHSGSYIKNVLQNEKRAAFRVLSVFASYGSHNKQRLFSFSIINQLVFVMEARCLL